MSYFLKHMTGNLWHGKFGLFPEDAVTHAISTRLGGTSNAPYSSLNLMLHVGDNAADVLQNRIIFANSLNFKAEHIVMPEQVHGTKVLRVSEADRGRGSRDYGDAISGTDALITDTPGLPLMLCFADCTPILFADMENHAVGIAHGGWKGTLQKIARRTLEAMGREFGTKPEECLAGIGPSIGPCCYEVGEDVQANCKEAFPHDWEKLLVRQESGKTHFNLWEANRLQLLQAGMKAENIECAEECTCCKRGWYFSYRGDGGVTGRIGAMIALNVY